MAKSNSPQAQADKVKKGLKGGTKPARTNSLVQAAAKSAGHGSQTNSPAKGIAAAKKNAKGSSKRFK